MFATVVSGPMGGGQMCGDGGYTQRARGLVPAGWGRAGAVCRPRRRRRLTRQRLGDRLTGRAPPPLTHGGARRPRQRVSRFFMRVFYR